jgi:hypothetical protein
MKKAGRVARFPEFRWRQITLCATTMPPKRR